MVVGVVPLARWLPAGDDAARAAMVEATVNLSKKYHITKLNLTPEEKAEDTKSGGPAEGESSRGMRLEPKRSPPVRWR